MEKSHPLGSKLSSGCEIGGPFLWTRVVRIPVALFFLIAIIAQISMQFKTSFQLHRTMFVSPDYSENSDTPKMIRIDRRNTILKMKTKFLNEHNNNISASRITESRNNTSQVKTNINDIDDIDQSRKDKKTSGIRERHQDRISNEEVQPDSHYDNKVETSRGENIMLIDRNYTSTTPTESFWDAVQKYKKKKYEKGKRKTRVIFGIMSYDSKNERQRRGLIRRTYLSYFTKHMNRTLMTEEEYNEMKHWICSLNDLDYGRLQYPEKCRMAYAFVQGANPNGTQMLLSFNETYPLSLPPPKNATKNEKKDASDSIYLNIDENGRFGKTPTWFRYAVDVLERHGWTNDWDFIFKSDTDNLIYTPNFFRYLDKKLSKKKPERIYGGFPLNYEKCGGDKHDDCKKMVGPYFMQGGCYFLSTDLAKFISDETTFDHEAVKLPHEDMTTGNFVYSHPNKIRVIGEPKKKFVIRRHPLKSDVQFKFRWEKMLTEEQAFLSARQV